MGKQFILLSFIIAFCTGCATLDVSLRPNTGFANSSSVTVECIQNDLANFQPRIEQALLKLGFDVISPSSAQTKLQYLGNSNNQLSDPATQRIPQSSSVNSSSGYVREYKSVYVLKFSYDYQYSLMGKAITDFTASIIDLRNGQVVGTISYSGNGDSSLPEGLANKISQKLSEELNH